jgi:hypothetical protein
MEPNRFPACPRPYRWGALLALGVVVIAAGELTSCHPSLEGTKGPPFVMDPGSIKQPGHWAALLDHLHALTFDTSSYAADRQFLLIKRNDTLRVGPYAELAPETGATGVNPSWRWADSGRVLARIVVRGGQYPPLGIDSAETTYVCVRHSPTHVDSTWALLIGVAGDTVRPVARLALTTRPHPGFAPPVARFRVDSADDGACFPCDDKWCCAKT